MLFNRRLERRNVLLVEFFKPDQLHVAARRKISGFVENVSDAAAHAGGEIASGLAENHHATPGHVFATVIADGLDDSVNAGVADAEALARHAAHKNLARRRAVKRHVADDDVVLGDKGGILRRIYNDFSAAQTFAQIIIRVAFKLNRHAGWHECAEALARAAVEFEMNRVFGQTHWAVFLRHFAAGDRAHYAVDVDDG